ncbi:hypothetical protein SAICODRAFT_28647 [Saitoella complicata NRRL Y-17804]|uniref:Uncharacterized protein n=1 Tax=Saitoella complicata (strain BCRC 22490 / CBS 7301 / JCM 7358 / NBRC 10748 / NRRL Y-17804) TaxID=698492 RepID=A0A0E9NAM4_SAICN|nr:uncharacterized protein SAICODRAFT_28647 [Saitoella complicata NRRL Y-17804]ODQ56569.1 hypothetical protein SAICODRAFT_28647 [Saitoella complicata NRRL Y-17804]GAO46455.1 hypothetical protein G7K_0686-t1 [Saitoella complicata NRRL Y-17804]
MSMSVTRTTAVARRLPSLCRCYSIPKREDLPESKRPPKFQYKEQYWPPVKVLETNTKEPIKPKPMRTPEQRRAAEMADLRRKYLREAVLAHEEVVEIEIEEKKAVEEKRAAYLEAKRNAPLAQDEVLTLPTIATLLNDIRPIDNPAADARHAAKKIRNREAAEADKEEEVLQNLLDLYHASETFIVNEEQLSAALDKAFDEALSAPKGLSYALRLEDLERRQQNIVSHGTESQKWSQAKDLLMGTAGGGKVGVVGVQAILAEKQAQREAQEFIAK